MTTRVAYNPHVRPPVNFCAVLPSGRKWFLYSADVAAAAEFARRVGAKFLMHWWEPDRDWMLTMAPVERVHNYDARTLHRLVREYEREWVAKSRRRHEEQSQEERQVAGR